MSRDPIGESGGNHLYGFVGNDGVNGWNVLGLMASAEAPRYSNLIISSSAVTAPRVSKGTGVDNIKYATTMDGFVNALKEHGCVKYLYIDYHGASDTSVKANYQKNAFSLGKNEWESFGKKIGKYLHEKAVIHFLSCYTGKNNGNSLTAFLKGVIAGRKDGPRARKKGSVKVIGYNVVINVDNKSPYKIEPTHDYIRFLKFEENYFSHWYQLLNKKDFDNARKVVVQENNGSPGAVKKVKPTVVEPHGIMKIGATEYKIYKEAYWEYEK